MKKKKLYKFKGWCWTELGECWNLPLTEEDEENAELIRNFIAKEICDSWTKKPNAAAKDIRRFLKALIKESEKIDYYGPFWQGLLNVKNDTSLLHLTSFVLEGMWT